MGALQEKARQLRRQGKAIEQCGTLSQACHFYELALEVYLQGGKKYRQDASRLLVEIALVYRDMEKRGAAHQKLEQAIVYYRLLGSPFRLELTQALYQQGLLYEEERLGEKAIRCHEEALQLLKECPEQEAGPAMARSLKQLGSIYFTRKKLESAFHSFQEALAIIEKPASIQQEAAQLEAAAIATLAAAICLAQPVGNDRQIARAKAARLLEKASHYLRCLHSKDELAIKRREELLQLQGQLRAALSQTA